MGLFEVTWDKDEIGANIYGSDFSTRGSTWGQMGRKPPFIDAIEALYQLSYDPLKEGKIKHAPGFLAMSFAVAGRR